MNIQSMSWQDWAVAQPLDPRSIIANATLGAVAGSFSRSMTFLQTSWGTNTVAFTGNNSQLLSLDITDAATVANAAQWTFSHRMAIAGASVNPSVGKVAFCKAGTAIDNVLEIAFGGTSWTNAQLSFRDNLGCAGSFVGASSGSIPVITFSGSVTGNVLLHLTFFQPGAYSLVFVLNNAGTFSTFEMEVIVLP